MNADIILKKKEDAVSPVIGVMLMLVVTIVIAAVVAAFAGGLGGDVEMAPTAVLDISAHAKDGDGKNKLKITSLSGDALKTSDISIKVQDTSGKPLGTADLDYSGTQFTPGSTAVVTLEMETGASLTQGTYVTVTVVASGKHVITTKDVLVKSALS